MKKEAKILHLNNNRENLTSEKIRTFSGFGELNDEQASEIVFAIQTFANILYELITQQTNEQEQKTAA